MMKVDKSTFLFAMSLPFCCLINILYRDRMNLFYYTPVLLR